MRACFIGVLAAVVVVGCSGGGSGPSAPTLQGKPAFRAAAIAGYQALGAGMAYPFTALQLSKPAGSSIPGRKVGRQGTPPTFNAALGLYIAAPQATATGYIVRYFTDAAGTVSAGTMTITQPPATAAGNGYGGYPAAVPLTVDLAQGNLPVRGSGAITYTGPSGANRMTGDFTLPRYGIQVRLDLSLTDALQVGGSVTVKENGATITVSEIAGNLNETLQGRVTVAPYGWSGTATLNLLTGEFSVNITDIGTAARNASGGLVLGYSEDNSTETVPDALTAPLVGSATPTPQPTPTPTPNPAAIYQAPVDLGDISPWALNTSGAFVGNSSRGGDAQAFFQASPDAARQLLAPYQGTKSFVTLIDDSNRVVGWSSDTGSVVWGTPTSAPVKLNGQAFSGNDKGELVGWNDQVFFGKAFYWATPTSAPTELAGPAAATLKNATARGISPNGHIVGGGTLSTDAFVALYWEAPGVVPTVLQNYAAGTLTSPQFVNDNGQVVGTTTVTANGFSVTRAIVWANKDAAPQLLPSLLGSTGDSVQGITENGTIAGMSGGKAVIWKDSQVKDLNTLIPTGTGWTLSGVQHINKNGWIIGFGTRVSMGDRAFLIKPR
jgi:hypothetical protein